MIASVNPRLLFALCFALTVFVLGNLGGCAIGPNAYKQAETRMYHASEMNTKVVNNALAANECPPGYREVDNVTKVSKIVTTSYREEVGRYDRGNRNYPYIESEAEDRTHGKGEIKCVRAKK